MCAGRAEWLWVWPRKLGATGTPLSSGTNTDGVSGTNTHGTWEQATLSSVVDRGLDHKSIFARPAHGTVLLIVLHLFPQPNPTQQKSIHHHLGYYSLLFSFFSYSVFVWCIFCSSCIVSWWAAHETRFVNKWVLYSLAIDAIFTKTIKKKRNQSKPQRQQGWSLATKTASIYIWTGRVGRRERHSCNLRRPRTARRR